MSYKLILILAGGFALCVATGYFLTGWKMRTSSQSFHAPQIPAGVAEAFSRDFAAMRAADEPMSLPDIPFTGPDGKEARITDFKGKPLLVNMWATWCAPCVVELPALKLFAEHYEGRLQVIGIALEAGKGHAEIADFLKKRELGTFAGYADPDGAFAGKLGLRGIPTSFLIGSDGLILYRFEGDADWRSAESKAFFDVFLAGQGANR